MISNAKSTILLPGIVNFASIQKLISLLFSKMFAVIAVELLLLSFAMADFADFVEKKTNYVGNVRGLSGAIELAVSPDGLNLYVIGFSPGSIAVFSIDHVVGTLNFVESHERLRDGIDDLYGVRDIEISPDGDYLYVSAVYGQSLIVFDRDPHSGRLTLVEPLKAGLSGLGDLSAVYASRISRDGSKLFAVGTDASARSYILASYKRDESTGLVSYADQLVQYLNEPNSLFGLGGVDSLEVSCDGKNVYAAGTFDNSIVTVSVVEESGVLAPIQVTTDKQDGIEGLYWPTFLLFGPRGKYLYSVAHFDETGLAAIIQFSRDPSTGLLHYIGPVNSPDDPAFAPVSPSSFAWNGNGIAAVAPNSQNDTLMFFSREIPSGRLAYSGAKNNGVPDFNGLGEPRYLAFGSRSPFFYAIADTDDSVMVFRLSPTEVIQTDGFEGCD